MIIIAEKTHFGIDQGNGTYKTTPASNVIQNPWLIANFNGLSEGQSVLNHANSPGSAANQRFNWALGSGIGFQNNGGIRATTAVHDTGASSCCAVSIAAGSDGDPSGGDTGAGGGPWGAAMNLPTPIAEGQEFWYGQKVLIPSGYNWNHGSGASKPGFIKFLRVNNSANGQRLEHHVINGSWNSNAAADSQQIGWSMANEFDTKSQSETHKQSDLILSLSQWHWMEFYIYAHSNPALAVRRLWIDSQLVFERVGPNNRWRNASGNYQTEILSSGERSLPNSSATLTSVMHGTYYNGYSPQNQTYYIEKIVGHNSLAQVVAEDSFGNRMMGPQ